MDNLIIKNYIEILDFKIPVITDNWNFNDYLGLIKARLNINRMRYKVQTGLYAIGKPDENSFVFVTANYKMSFDYLRQNLNGIDAWILILETYGINVWCAAGKGTFGTEELINQINSFNLKNIVNHKKIILPQLGAPGVSSHIVESKTGFKVIYGPIKAKDIKEFLDLNLKATQKMRKVNFNIIDRIVLIPVELTIVLKKLLLITVFFVLLSGVNKFSYSYNLLLKTGFKSFLFILTGFALGNIITPILLPYIPGNAFALKGLVLSIITFIIYIKLSLFSNLHIIETISWFLLISSISSYYAMNFTGTSTYTSFSGVKKEMDYAVPIQIIFFSLGIILWTIKRFI